jgi:drug/metabolite transporter (DMT)-like permease
MINLLGSIVLTSWLTLSFKWVEQLRLDRFQVIVFNYIFCVITGSIVNGEAPHYNTNAHASWFGWACLMGTVFISLFSIIGFTAQKIGVAVTSVANKLSLVIPFIFSIYLYDEKAGWLKITGVIIALLAVVLTCLPAKEEKTKSDHTLLYVLPIALFLGSGLLDTMIKYVEHQFLVPGNVNDYLITAFSTAAALGSIVLTILLITGKQKFMWKSVAVGAAIGIPNYFSIWFLMRVLKKFSNNSSAIIPINNMGIVLFSAVMAWMIFKERLSIINWVGIALALGAIALIAYG